MQTIRLYSYNNYYNRIVKKESTLSDYGEPLYTKSNHNFIPGDGIRTNIVINFIAFTKQPNYLIVEDNGIFTHWFITSAKRERGLQYSLDLKRDVLVDYYEDILVHSECIIQKGYINDKYKVLQYTKEQQNYNKVKQNEFLIKDKGGIGYVCGFISNQAFNVETEVVGTFNADVAVDREFANMNDFNTNFGFASYFAVGSTIPTNRYFSITSTRIKYKNIELTTSTDLDRFRGIICKQDIQLINDIYTEGTITTGTTGKYRAYTEYNTNSVDSKIKGFYTNVANYIAANKPSNIIKSFIGDQTIPMNTVKSLYEGKIFKIGPNVYQVKVVEQVNPLTDYNTIPSGYYQTFKNYLPTSISNYVSGYSTRLVANNIANEDIEYAYKSKHVYFSLVPQQTEAKVTVPNATSRTHLIDAPYDMFIIPYDDYKEYKVGSSTFIANKNLAINIAQAIGLKSGGTEYDVQIVPYCPLDAISSSGVIDFGSYDYSYIKSGTTNIGAIIWSHRSTFNITIEESRSEFNPTNIKESIDLDLYRLSSPDSSSQWEFNPVMNDGITEWNIACDYRPYSSYIRVQPKWGGLYANDNTFTDTDIRGLIYNGNYSITQLNNAWSTYVNNNKNYQAIFDQQISTQIKGYDLQNKAAYDTMFMRSYSTNPLLASFSAWGNMKEQEYNEKTQQINLENQRALYNLNLDNIKAMPNTISKMTSINQDFRIFPYVEYYSCTEEEKQIYRDMIKYNGMSINVTGHISDFLHPTDETFIQATMVRFYAVTTGDESDYDLVQDINRELSLGVYITKE